MEELRDKIYYWSMELMKEGKRSQSIILLLATWNFAYFRYHMKEFKLSDFETLLDDCDFDYFCDKKFDTTDLNEEKTKKKIMKIYEALSQFTGISYVGASKVMHLMRPDFFMMWDTKIKNHYNVGDDPSSYHTFMVKMQEMFNQGKFEDLEKGVTVPRAIDIYNIENYSDI